MVEPIIAELFGACVIISMKIHLNRLPVELRVRVYEFATLNTIMDYYGYFQTPWGRRIYLSGALNDVEGLELAAIQGIEQRKIMCELIALTGNLSALKWARVQMILVE